MSEEIEWFISIVGPDDIQECESEEDATKKAEALNEFFKRVALPDDGFELKANVGFRLK